jgi:glycosyltransferase involved in cell wall biosynthesis
MHYGLPLALHRAGILDRVFTEFFAEPGSAEAMMVKVMAPVRPELAKRMSLRYCSELPIRRMIRNPWLLIPEQFARIGSSSLESYQRRCTQLVGRWVQRLGFGTADVFFGFVRNVDPQLCRRARRQGLTVVGDQIIAPALIQNRESMIQQERWTGWEPPPVLSGVRDLEHETWATCHHLTAPSEYVKTGLIEEGVDPDKISVLPYPVAPDWYCPIQRSNRTKPLTVGFVGTVNLRKGVPYFFEVARRLPRSEFRFKMVGPVHLFPDAVERHRGPVEVVGGRSRKDAARLLDEFDVFFFPSTCEGSAGSVMEAMTAGLPVICSPNTGSVVRDGIDGHIVPYDDIDSAVDKIVQLAADPERRLEMGRSARARALSFDVDEYSRMLVAMFGQLFATPKLGVS